MPRPETAHLSKPDNVLDWIQQARQAHGQCVLRTFASSAVRLVQCARQRGLDLAGLTIFTGGEALTDSRRRFIESVGVRVFPRYVASEPGLIGGGCAHRLCTDDMHVYTDRVAVIPGPQDRSLLFTTLSSHTGKVLLNTDLGDSGDLVTHRCDCVFGQLGFDVHVARVSSQQRVTVEGMTVLASELDGIIRPMRSGWCATNPSSVPAANYRRWRAAHERNVRPPRVEPRVRRAVRGPREVNHVRHLWHRFQ